jgi:hypothetical protein
VECIRPDSYGIEHSNCELDLIWIKFRQYILSTPFEPISWSLENLILCYVNIIGTFELSIKEVVNLSSLLFLDLFVGDLNLLDILIFDLLSHFYGFSFGMLLSFVDLIRQLGKIDLIENTASLAIEVHVRKNLLICKRLWTKGRMDHIEMFLTLTIVHAVLILVSFTVYILRSIV